MDVFIDTPQRAAERLERERRLRDMGSRVIAAAAATYGGASHGGGEAQTSKQQRRSALADAPHDGGGERASAGPCATCQHPMLAGGGLADSTTTYDLDEPEPYSVACDAYRQERAYDARRTRHRKLARVLRVLAIIVLVPVAVIAVFLGAYALTYIVRGASPDELAAAMASLFSRIDGLLHELGGFAGSLRGGFV